MWLTEVQLAKWRQGLVLKPGSAANFGFKVGSAHGVVRACVCVRVRVYVRACVCVCERMRARARVYDKISNHAARRAGREGKYGRDWRPGRTEWGRGRSRAGWDNEKSVGRKIPKSLPDRIRYYLLRIGFTQYNPAKRLRRGFILRPRYGPWVGWQRGGGGGGTAEGVTYTLRASLSGIFLQRKEGCHRKPVLGVWVS